MKLGLIGFGRWAENIIRSLPPGAELTAIATSRTSGPLGVELVPYVDDLPLSQLDGVIIASQASDHGLHMAAVCRMSPGLPIFLEKPAVASLEWANYFTSRACSPRVLLVDHTQLFNANLLDLKRNLDGVPPAHIHGVDRGIGPVRDDCNPLQDYGPHAVAIALYLAGFPFPGGVHVRDAWLDKTENGATIDFELQLGAKTVATLSVGNNALEKTRHYSARSPGGATRTFEGLAANTIPPLSAALAAFCDAVATGAPPAGDARFGWALPLEVTRVLSDIEDVLMKRCTPLA